MRISKDTKVSKITIDRLEGDFAVCETENKVMIDLPLNILPSGAQEGSVYDMGLTELKNEEAEQKKRIKEKSDRLWAD